MADTRNEWRTERRGERADGASGWLDDRGVSEVIGSILVFGLLVSLLAIVQTQAVPDANSEVEVQHSADVQGDLANLQAAISRTSAFGGTESTTVETGMTYPPRLVLYNPPAVQGTLRTNDVPDAQVGRFVAADPTANQNFNRYLQNPNTTYPTNVLTYEANYNRFQDSPTIRYEYGALVSDYGNQSTVQTEGNLVNGDRISLTYLEGGLQESQVRPASLTTYPVSAPGRTVEVETESKPGQLLLSTDIDKQAWVGEILTDQIDMNALPSQNVSTCSELNEINNSNPAATNDGRFIVGCDYFEPSGADTNLLLLQFQTNSTYKMQMSKVGFSASVDDPPGRYLVAEDALTESGNVTLQLFDRYNNPATSGTVSRADFSSSGVSSTVERNYTASNDGEITIEKPSGAKAYYIGEGPHAYVPNNGTSCVNSSACTISTRFSAGSTPVRLANALLVADDEVQLTFQNLGSDRKIERIKLNYATVHERKSVLDTANTVTGVGNLLGALVDVQFGETTATDIVDGPEEVTEVRVDNGATSGSATLSNPAVENRVSRAAPSSLPTLTGGSNSAVTLTFDQSVNSGTQNNFGNSGSPEDMLEVSVTVTYSDGYRKTYVTQIHAPEDDARP